MAIDRVGSNSTSLALWLGGRPSVEWKYTHTHTQTSLPPLSLKFQPTSPPPPLDPAHKAKPSAPYPRHSHSKPHPPPTSRTQQATVASLFITLVRSKILSTLSCLHPCQNSNAFSKSTPLPRFFKSRASMHTSTNAC